jgi:hypothetical protein
MERVIAILTGVFIIGVAGTLYLATPQYQIVVRENQTIVWRVNMRTGELAVCASFDLPAAGCKSLPGSSAGYLSGFVSEPHKGAASQ